jgi:hypothetical protein
MKRLVAFTEVWCADEAPPIGKTGSVVIMEADTHFTEDPISKLYAQTKKEIRSRGYSTLAICPFSSRAVYANLDDRRWELLSHARFFRLPKADLTPSTLQYRVEEPSRSELNVNELYCLDQSVSPAYLWASLWDEFDQMPEMKGAIRKQTPRRVHLEYNGQALEAVLWLWTLSDVEDYWRLSIWVPPGKEEDRDLVFELIRIAAGIWNGDDIPGFVLTADEENAAFLSNRGLKADETRPAEPRYYTAV